MMDETTLPPMVHPRVIKEFLIYESLDKEKVLALAEKGYDGIDDYPEHHAANLLLQVASVTVHGNDRHNCNAAPVCGKSNEADKDGDCQLLPIFPTGLIDIEGFIGTEGRSNDSFHFSFIGNFFVPFKRINRIVRCTNKSNVALFNKTSNTHIFFF